MPVPPFLNNLAGLNAVASAKGGILTYLNEINTLNGIDIIEAGTGGYLNGLSALNSIDVLLGGSGGYFNELDVLNSIVVLEGGVGGHLNTIGAINEWVDNAEGALSYLLRATWDVDDVGFVDAEVLGPSKGVEDGNLTVAETDGTLAVVSNKCAVTAHATAGWAELGLRGQGQARLLGKAFFCDLNASVKDLTLLGWHKTANFAVGSEEFAFFLQSGSLSYWDGGTQAVLGDWAISTDYTFVAVLGGFNSSGVAWFTGETPADYARGMFLFVKGGAFTDWTLLWVEKALNTATLYPLFQTNDAFVGTLDNLLVPDRDYSLVQIPVHLSTFDAVDGTQVESVTPEVGTAFLVKNGSAHVQSNKATNDGAVPGGAGIVYATETGESDVFLTDTINPAVGEDAGISARYTDNDNFWALHVDETANVLILYERVAGSYVSRATSAVTITAGVDYDLTFILHGTTITGFVNGLNRVTFTSVVGQTKTEHGFTILTAGTTHNNFVARPITSSVYDTELNNN